MYNIYVRNRRFIMIYITATELKNNLGHYLDLAKNEDVYITKNKKIIAILSNPREKALDRFLSLKGILKTSESECKTSDELVGEVIMTKCAF